MDVKTDFLNGSLEETILWFNQKIHCKGSEIKVCELQKILFVDFSRHLGLGTSVLTDGSRHLDLSNVLINLVCTGDAAETWW